MSERNAYQAGRFYPDRPDELKKLLDELSAAAGTQKCNVLTGIVPHAGIIYSGYTASFLYNSIRDDYSRIVIIGPSHNAYFNGFALSSSGYWNTPLGNVPVDMEYTQGLISDISKIMDDAHAQEHSIEVQLPFIYRHFSDRMPVVPVMMGAQTALNAEAFANMLIEHDDGNTLYIASSDLYHGFDYEEAKSVDSRTLAAVMSGSPQKFNEYYLDMEKEGSSPACGSGPISIIMKINKALGLKLKLLHHTTSSDVTQDFTGYTVGYSSFMGVRDE